jgi:protocatechuate 4,5-dioxygenase alpha chain
MSGNAYLTLRRPPGHIRLVPSLAQPPLNLDEPGTFEFTAQRALQGRALNRFALSLRTSPARAAFVADEPGAMRAYHLSEDEVALVRARDWTGLLQAGGHLQAISKIAGALGLNLWDIGAHNVGCTRDELIASCPRTVTGLPAGSP